MTVQFDDLADLETAILSAPPPRGRLPKSLAFGPSRPLEGADIAALYSPTAIVTPVNPLQEIRHRHHLLARLVAEGHKYVAISGMIGISQSRITVLMDDPAMQELVAHYAEKVQTEYLDVHTRLASLGVSAMEELQERLDDEEKRANIKTKELTEIIEKSFDRSIAPNKSAGASSGVSVSVNFIKSETPSITLEGKVVEVEALD